MVHSLIGRIWNWSWILLWLGGIVAGLGAMLRFEMTPGNTLTGPLNWPVESALKLDADRPTLLVFLHPFCPCSRATLSEIQALSEQCDSRFTLRIVMVTAETLDTRSESESLWHSATGIPNADVVWDEACTEAKRFRATTSGETFLYGVDGGLKFQGGVTVSRGHVGESPGRELLNSLIQNGGAEASQTPVYGCPLFKEVCLKCQRQCPCPP